MIPGSGRSPGDGIGYSLQYSGLENSMASTVHGVTKSQAGMTEPLSLSHVNIIFKKCNRSRTFGKLTNE